MKMGVTGNTLVLTNKGHIKIKLLKNKKVKIWNGIEFIKVNIKQTDANRKLLTIKFSNGSKLICARNHKFYIQNGRIQTKKDIVASRFVKITKAKDLEPEMKLVKCEYPEIDNEEELRSAYTNGMFSGDGCYDKSNGQDEKDCTNKSLEEKAYCGFHIDNQIDEETSYICRGRCFTVRRRIELYNDKTRLIEHLDYTSKGEERMNSRGHKVLCVSLPSYLEDKFFVPMNYSMKSKLDWLAGISDADGHISETRCLKICNVDNEFFVKNYISIKNKTYASNMRCK